MQLIIQKVIHVYICDHGPLNIIFVRKVFINYKKKKNCIIVYSVYMVSYFL